MPYTAYKVQSGDTLSSIANAFFGNGALFRTILNAAGNPLPNPNQIAVDQLLLIPQLDDFIEYDIQSGDTLSALAAAFFGKSNLHNLFLDIAGNPIANPNAIAVGMRLRVPVHARISSSLTPSRLANLTYQATFGATTLDDGLFEFANPDFGGDISSTRLSRLVYGDLTGNGVDDAAVILVSHTTGTTGHFADLFAVPEGAATGGAFPLHLVGAGLGDRVRVNRFMIREQIVHVVAAEHLDTKLTARRFQPIGDAMAVGLTEVT